MKLRLVTKIVTALVAVVMVLPTAAYADPPSESDLIPVFIPGNIENLDPSEFGLVSPTDLPAGSDIYLDDAARCYRRTGQINYHWGNTNHVAFYFRMTKDWCANRNDRITSWSVTTSGHVYSWAQPVWDYEGLISDNDFYYNSRHSHYSFREGKFQATCWGVPCGSKTPEIIIRVNGNGTSSFWWNG